MSIRFRFTLALTAVGVVLFGVLGNERSRAAAEAEARARLEREFVVGFPARVEAGRG